MKIEVLYLDGCPNHFPAVERVKEVLHEMSLSGEVVEVRITDSATAMSMCFLGSPTVRVNGLDVEPLARKSDWPKPGCRTYVSGIRRDGLPAKELVRQAILRLQ